MKRYTFNPVAKTLVITAAFAKAMQNIESEEYALYTQLMADIPNLKVIRETHKTPSKYHTKSGETFNCNQFKNLTYKNMETFIMGLPAAETYMKEYLSLKNHAAEVQTNGYTIIRRWFVTQFPDFRKNPLTYLNTQPAVVSGAEVADQHKAEMAPSPN